MKIEPVVLQGRHVRLEPLTRAHLPALCEVGLDPVLWRWTTTLLETAEDMRVYVEAALAWQQAGTALPFVTVSLDGERVVGSTRFANIDESNRRAEIGWTWIAAPWQRTAVNTEAKLLMLTHAFEGWRCIRVELKTDALNEASRRAIRRLGAMEEGVLRHHMIAPAGRLRDTVYYSILAAEWPLVRRTLEERLAAHGR